MIKIRITKSKDSDCGCGDPCLEETPIEVSDESKDQLINQIVSNVQDASPTEKDEFLSTNLAEEELEEGTALVDEHFDIYEAVQDAVDEDGGAPCPQCLYELLADAACGCPDLIPEATYQGRKVELNKPMKGDVKKSKVYVKNPKGNVVKVNFGHGGSSAKKKGEKTMRIRKSNKKARKSFRARHKCKTPGPRHKARYWSCKAW
jgi:hypothetical protein